MLEDGSHNDTLHVTNDDIDNQDFIVNDEDHDVDLPETERKLDRACKNKNEVKARRSNRDLAAAQLLKTDIVHLLNKIKENHADTVVLKIKDHVLADISSVVLDAIIAALYKNKALYVQNLSKAWTNKQLFSLIELLKKKMIWCLNIGENYEISTKAWETFCSALPETNVTHLYVSEHVIPIDLKNKMRFHIRENRKKHDRHCAFKNLRVIERCTNMWWNPINGVKELKPQIPPEVRRSNEIAKLTPAHTAYWQEGVGPGGSKPWKFKCVCGETCSSYENFRYHPTGKMFECSVCSVWGHVVCVLGEKVTDDDLEEMEGVMCNVCRSKARRLMKHGPVADDWKHYNYDLYDNNDVIVSTTAGTNDNNATSVDNNGNNNDTSNSNDTNNNNSDSNQTRNNVKTKSIKSSNKQSNIDDVLDANENRNKKNNDTKSNNHAMDLKKRLRNHTIQRNDINNGEKRIKSSISKKDHVTVEWRFKCICGDNCSSYESIRYHPMGRWYECSQCALWSHVDCNYGEKITDREIREDESCRSKSRRSVYRNRDNSSNNDNSSDNVHETSPVKVHHNILTSNDNIDRNNKDNNNSVDAIDNSGNNNHDINNSTILINNIPVIIQHIDNHVNNNDSITSPNNQEINHFVKSIDTNNMEVDEIKEEVSPQGIEDILLIN